MMIKKYFPILLFIFVVLIYRRWIYPFDNLTHGDWWFIFRESLINSHLHAFSLWRSMSALGGIPFDLGQAPVYAFSGFLATYFGFHFSIIERIVYLWPIMLLTPLSSYVLLKHFFSSRIAILAGVAVYSFNTYFLVLETGHLTLMGAYAAAPLLIYAYLKTLEVKRLFWALTTGLIFCYCVMYEPRAAYIFAWILIFYFFFHLITHSRKEIKEIGKVLYFGAIPFFIVAAVNFYWVFALLNVGVVSTNALFQRVIYGNEFLNILYSLTLFHPFWTGKNVGIFSTQMILPYFWLYPLLALAGVFVARKNKNVIFFAFIALVGIFLSKQADVPFPSVYSWMYQHFPGFNAFREASKFYFLIALGYSVLIASFFSWLWNLKPVAKSKLYLRYFITTTAIFFFIWNTKPLLTGEIGTLFVKRETPNDFLIVKNYILKDIEYSRSVWVPTFSRWSITTQDHPYIGMIYIINGDWNKYLGQLSVKNSDEDNIIHLSRSPEFKQLLSNSSIKYVVISRRGRGNEEDWVGEIDNRKKYIQEINNIPYLKKINIGTKEIMLYENKESKPHIYRTSEKESIRTLIPFEKVNYQTNNPTTFTIKIKEATGPFYLHLTERFHPDWSVRIGSFSWLESMNKSNYFISQKNHIENEVGLNSYYIDPNILCKDYSCQKNEDGSYSFSLTYYFKSQSYLYIGMIISGIAIVTAAFLFIFYAAKETKKR